MYMHIYIHTYICIYVFSVPPYSISREHSYPPSSSSSFCSFSDSSSKLYPSPPSFDREIVEKMPRLSKGQGHGSSSPKEKKKGESLDLRYLFVP